MSSSNHKLAAVVCGMPFSGTTFMSRMICANEHIDSGFECGLLFGDAPRNFPESGRYYEWMMDTKPPYNWNLTQSELDDVCQSENFHEAYAKIVEHCHLFKASKKFVLDKTPAYVYQLTDVLTKIQEVPVIVVQKEKMNQYYSFKKRNQSLEFFIQRYHAAQNEIQSVRSKSEFRDRVLLMPFRDLVDTPGKSYRKMINFIGRFNHEIKFAPEQVKVLSNSLSADMKGKKKLRPKFSVDEEYKAMMEFLTKEEVKAVESLN